MGGILFWAGAGLFLNMAVGRAVFATHDLFFSKGRFGLWLKASPSVLALFLALQFWFILIIDYWVKKKN